MNPVATGNEPQSRAAQVACFPNAAPETRFGIVQEDYSELGIAATQVVGGSELGWLGVFADFATGRAAMGRLPADVGFRTASMHIDAGSESMSAGDVVRATGRLSDIGRGDALGSAELRTADGHLIALVSTRFVIVPGAIAPAAQESIEVGAHGVTLAEFLGVEFLETSPLTARARVPAVPWMVNPFGIVHGGITVALADVGANMVELGEDFRTLSLDINLHRPARIGEQMMICATAARVGARVAVIEVEIRQEAVVASATVTLGRD